MSSPCRVFPIEVESGAYQMAADEQMLLDAIDDGRMSLRFYRWSEPTVSLGYFQSWQDYVDHPVLSKLAVVRRATGGATLVHHHELTYSFALPVDRVHVFGKRSWLGTMHECIQRALATWGIGAELCSEESGRGSVLCFQHHTPCDLLVNGHKVAGSAQRKRRGALLQHGGILLRQSPFAPELSGIGDSTKSEMSAELLAARLETEWAKLLGCDLERRPWDDGELAKIGKLQTTRYSSSAWTKKR